jgi:hypothetical protein
MLLLKSIDSIEPLRRQGVAHNPTTGLGCCDAALQHGVKAVAFGHRYNASWFGLYIQ